MPNPPELTTTKYRHPKRWGMIVVFDHIGDESRHIQVTRYASKGFYLISRPMKPPERFYDDQCTPALLGIVAAGWKAYSSITERADKYVA